MTSKNASWGEAVPWLELKVHAFFVIPALSRYPADARLRGVKGLSSPRTWAGWMPDQVRHDGGECDQCTVFVPAFLRLLALRASILSSSTNAENAMAA